MKTTKQTDAAEKQKLMGEVRLARLQLAKAESQLAEAKEQARLARRRRKAAKQSARRAKKLAKQTKEKVAAAKLALVELEAKLARPNPPRVKRKPRRTPAKKVAAAPRRKVSVATVDTQPREILKVRKPVARRTKSKRKLSPTGKAAKKSAAVARDLETPIAMIPPEVSKATVQIIKGVEEIFTGKCMAEATVETGAQVSITPPDKNPSPPDQNLHNAAINKQETP